MTMIPKRRETLVRMGMTPDGEEVLRPFHPYAGSDTLYVVGPNTRTPDWVLAGAPDGSWAMRRRRQLEIEAVQSAREYGDILPSRGLKGEPLDSLCGATGTHIVHTWGRRGDRHAAWIYIDRYGGACAVLLPTSIVRGRLLERIHHQ